MQKLSTTVRCLLLALVLATGITIAWGAVSGSVWDAIVRRQRNTGNYEQLIVQIDGTPAIVTRSMNYYQQSTARSLKGQSLASKRELNGGTLAGTVQLTDYAVSSDWTFRLSSFQDGQSPEGRWYFVHDGRVDGCAWFEGFDLLTKRRIGFIGRRGFTTQRPDANDWFPFDARLRSAIGYGRLTAFAVNIGLSGPAPTEERDGRISLWMCYLVSDGRLWEVNLRQRSVRELLADARLISAAVAEQAVPANVQPQSEPEQRLVARSADRLWVVHPDTGATRQFPLSAELRDDSLEVYVVEDGLLLRVSDRWSQVSRGPQRFVWLDAEGKILRESEPLRPQRFGETTGESWRDAVAGVSVVPVPVLLGVGVFIISPMAELSAGRATSYTQAVGEFLAVAWWLIPLVIVLAAIAAGWCYRRHRRYGQSAAAAWLVFVFLLGLPGLLAYLVHRHWPVLEACPACRQAVPRDRDACLACGQTVPPPPVVGTEVFA